MLRVLKLALIVSASLAALSANAAAQQQPAFTGPDNGVADVASNASGTTDKVLTLNPSGSSDDDFWLEVYVQDGGNITVLDSVH